MTCGSIRGSAVGSAERRGRTDEEEEGEVVVEFIS
jgi:hypothetical protein